MGIEILVENVADTFVVNRKNEKQGFVWNWQNVETIFPYRSIGIELQSLAAGDTDDFKIQSYIRIFSEIGSCLGIDYFGEQIKEHR